jgi:hypothetical protein
MNFQAVVITTRFLANFHIVTPNEEDPKEPTSPPPAAAKPAPPAREVGGREGPEPTRYGDWELRGRCIDF